jgi:hypothetical protein
MNPNGYDELNDHYSRRSGEEVRAHSTVGSLPVNWFKWVAVHTASSCADVVVGLSRSSSLWPRKPPHRNHRMTFPGLKVLNVV